ncbi:unnamed protein product (macronuclear) [Paramecium tetraurelia]|uniref:60S acidic ribosomal protein P2 n=1 Tax=Paramecium tetraurelia TaxID=5888 RepID=A0BPU8_PARTE|nr:uncharacterized protein GSPATT00005315001 [Paramecium tetraurelia]CAK60565.1 unnamed protein product [Paramecium tetraurelia]|eukprot:XP_001427963.1 hypothetical protein (macronuclear) [Paramecium tetraurelia strain d4-2]
MKYVAAYALLVLGGTNQPTVDQVTQLLKEAGVEPVAADVKLVVDALKGKTLADVIKEGSKSLTSLSVGGGASQSSAPVAQAAQTQKAEAPKAAEAPKKAEEPEEDVDMGGLFD